MINNCNYNGFLAKFDKEIKLIINKLGLYSALIYNKTSISDFYYKDNNFRRYFVESFCSDKDLHNICLNEKYQKIFMSKKDYILSEKDDGLYISYIMFGLHFNLFSKQDLSIIDLKEVCKILINNTKLSDEPIRKLFINKNIKKLI